MLVASEFPFAKIVGVEISRELSGIAEQNVMRHRSISQRCTTFSLHCADSTDYTFESEPLVLFLFNFPLGRIHSEIAPCQSSGLIRRITSRSLSHLRQPAFERLVRNAPFLRKIKEGGAWWRPWSRYVIYAALPNVRAGSL